MGRQSYLTRLALVSLDFHISISLQTIFLPCFSLFSLMQPRNISLECQKSFVYLTDLIPYSSSSSCESAIKHMKRHLKIAVDSRVDRVDLHMNRWEARQQMKRKRFWEARPKLAGMQVILRTQRAMCSNMTVEGTHKTLLQDHLFDRREEPRTMSLQTLESCRVWMRTTMKPGLKN